MFFLLRETIVSWYRTGAKFGMWLLFSLLFLVSGKKEKNFPPRSLLLHFLLKVSEKRKKCDGIEVPEKKGTFSSCGMYARIPQKGKFDFQIILQTQAGFLWSSYA